MRMEGSSPEARTTGEGRNEEPESLLVSPRSERRSVVLPLPTGSVERVGQRSVSWTLSKWERLTRTEDDAQLADGEGKSEVVNSEDGVVVLCHLLV